MGETFSGLDGGSGLFRRFVDGRGIARGGLTGLIVIN